MTEHTPGPWEVIGWRPPHAVVSGNFFSPGQADEIFVVERVRDIANARLIAAAPELLAACEAALAHICGDGWDGTEGQHPDNPLPQQLRAAIAKVKGE